MICISKDAKDFISTMVSTEENNQTLLTLSSAGTGCGAPVIKIDMRQPLDGDEILEVDSIPIRVRPAVKRYLNDAEIMLEDTFWGQKLKVKTLYGCRD